MSETKPHQFRLSEETMAKINALAKAWGGKGGDTTKTNVVRIAIDMAHDVEFPKKKKPPKKS